MLQRMPALAAIAATLFTCAALSPAVTLGSAPVNSCLACHEDGKRMAELGYPHFTVTRAEVEKQSGMAASCPDCHLGDPAKTGKEEAHRGMGRLLLVKKKGLTAEPAERRYPLEVTTQGTPPLATLTYYGEKDGKKWWTSRSR